ncbi:TetR family transcriptional regulator [Rhodovulum steppense]|uniref:HTH-type transcriptional regulator BetI n=2 Tax=Rhodovulum steppense TaxID=540251 RepID=A0A4R1YUK2_9RHOB|nr:TetR family transcriptional regulator [Rhodovulum steppense]
MEPIRRAALIEATIAEIGEAGSLDIPVARIARRAGVSSALAHHYLGSKEQIFLTAMRYTLAEYGRAVARALAAVDGPEARLRAIVEQSFSPVHFRRGTISAWMNFYALAHSNPTARRLLGIYRRRLGSNLRHALRPLLGARAPAVAQRMAFLIDGVYLHEGLGDGLPDGAAAARQVLDYLALECRGTSR